MRRKLRRVLFLIMTATIVFVGCGESNATKTVDKKASIATEEKKSDDLINNQKKEETVEMEQESFEKETIKKEDAKKEDSKKNDAKKDTSKQENTVQNDSKKNDSKTDSKKKETSNKTNPSTSNKKQETTKPSASASTPTKPATNSGSNKENSNKTESVHQHNYVAQTHVVHHEATGHNEQYVEQEEELMQMLEKARKEMPGLEKEENSSEAQLIEDSRFNEERVNVPNFGTQKEEWDLSGTIEQCIIRYASKLDGDQMNEILLGLEEGLTDEQVKSYFKLPADQMKPYRREILNEK